MISDPATAALVHAAFEYAGIGLGVALYRRARRTSGLAAVTAQGSFALMAGLLVGAALGNKLVFAIERPDLMLAWWRGEAPLQLGQSIVGGLLGGLIGIELAKWWTRQPASTGDLMVTPIALGLAVGRVGCFLAGLHDDTYGLPTSMPWGMDLGDGVRRQPTMLFEMAVVLTLAGMLHRVRHRLSPVPGLGFKLFLSCYLVWRCLGDFLKPVRAAYPLDLSGIQWVCLLALLVYLPLVLQAMRGLRRTLAPNPER